MSNQNENEQRLAALAAFAAGLHVTALPPSALSVTKAATLYGLAVGVASAGSVLLQKIAVALDRLDDGATSCATRLLDGRMGTARSAAMANGALLHVRMQEDAHPAGHVGVAILPAALASAQERGADGADFLAAVAAGYEVALRIGRDHAATLSGRGFRTTPIYGALGAAAATARLNGLDARQTAHAVSLAANLAGGLRAFQEAGTPEYALHAGFAADHGVLAVALAAADIPAATTVLSGTAGFYRAFGDTESDFGERLLCDLGSRFEIEKITYKPYPGGQFHRRIVAGLATLREQAAGRPVTAIRVSLNPFVAEFPGLRFSGPFETYSQAFYSVPFCAALTWTDGSVTFRGLHRFDDPALRALITRVDVLSDPDRPVYGPGLAVDLSDGSVLRWEETTGEAAYRLTWPCAVDMTERLGDEVGASAATIAALVDAVDALDDAPSIEGLVQVACDAVAEARAAQAV